MQTAHIGKYLHLRYLKCLVMICVKNHGNPSHDWFLSLGLSTWLSPGFNNHVFSRRLYHSSLTQFDSVELKFVASEMLRRQNETKEVGALTSPQNSQDWYESTCAVRRAVWNEVMEITDNRTSGVWIRVHGSVAITTFKCRWDSFLQLCHLCSQPFAHNVNDLEPPRPSKTKSKKKNRTNG